MNRGQAVVAGSLGAIAVLATVRSVSTRPGLPPPGIYIGAGALFTIWYFVAAFAPAFGGVLAVGTVVSSLLAPYLAGGSGNSPITQLAQLVSSISGGNSAPSTSGAAASGPTAPAPVNPGRSSGNQYLA